MDHLSMKDVIYTENLQQIDDNKSALDQVVDPCTEFQLQFNPSVKSPNEAFNLPKQSTRKHSLTSLRGKISYKVDDNELPRVHRTSSTQSVTSMLRKENFKRNFSESSDFNGSDQTIYSSASNHEVAETRDISSGACTPVAHDTSFISDDSPIFPSFNHDRLETASNISLTSNLTDVPGSNISSVSDLTGYEEELFQIKKLLIHGSSQSLYRPELASTNRINSNDTSAYKHKIEDLEFQLQETLAENEKYKFDLNDLENKVELIWREKFQEVLRQKAQCEGQLENVRKQYESTLNEKEKILKNIKQSDDKNSLRAEFTKIQLKLNYLEKQNSDLQSKLILSSNESKQWQSEFLKTEAENEKLRITLQEMKSEIDSKNSVLFGLKNKITEQHIELQNQIQAKMKLNNHITTLNNDIESVKKSEKWYIDQLHGCQLVKSNIQQELMSTQTNLITATQKVENMRMEIAHWKNMCDEIQRKAMREKEKLLRKVEMIEADILEREAILKCTQTEDDTKIEMNYIAKTVNDSHDYKIILQDYEEQLSNMKKIISDQNSSIENLHKQNTEYLVRLTTVQKNYNEKEINNQTIQNRNQDLEMKCNSYSEDLRTKDNELLELRNKIVNLEVALHAANREKQEIDEVVKNLRDDFNKFMKCYQSMKEKLEEKSKMITQFEHEKQELFMENNWRVCEIEELHHKVLDIKGLQAEIMELKNIYNQIMIEKEELLQNNNVLKTANESLETDCDSLKLKITDLEQNLIELKQQASTISNEDLTKLTKEITNFENEILKLNEVLRIREEQLFNQTKNCELLNSEIEEKEKFITDLQYKLSESINSLQRGTDFSSEIEQINIDLQTKVTDLNKKLLDANSVIEQFNMLCRNSETEKHNLSNQLNLLKKEIENTRVIQQNKNVNNSISTIDRKIGVDVNTQTDFTVESLEINSVLQNIKSRLLELISDNNNVSNSQISSSNVNVYNISDIIIAINEHLNQILCLKEGQVSKLEISEKANKILRAKLLKLKRKTESKLNILNERSSRLDASYQQIQNIIDVFNKHQNNIHSRSSSIGIQVDIQFKADHASRLMQEVKDLKTLLRVNEMERKEHYKRFETNNRTLLRKVKEHIRGRKALEKKLASLEDTYSFALTEINNSKIINNRLEMELATYKTRCDEYKVICEKLNKDILKLEKEKNELEIPEKVNDCLNCLHKDQINREFKEIEYKYKSLEEKLHWQDKEIHDKDQGITECKKQLFNEKLQCSALKKQVSSIQMCLDNANEQLDNKQVEFGHLKSVVEKLEINEKLLTDQLENAHIQYQECKRKLESTNRLLDEKTSKDEILGDEIKTLSCHLHQKSLEMSNLQNKYVLLESQTSSAQSNHQKIVDELQSNLAELQVELDSVRNDKFFLQRLSADLKMSLQCTLNQNKVLKLRLETLESETKNLTEKLRYDSLPNLPSPSKIDEEYINRLLQQSTTVPNKPLKNLRSCLDSLKQEMATLQREIIAKTQSDISL